MSWQAPGTLRDRHDAAVRRVAKRIAEVCRAKGITQNEMAERLRCATKNYQRIEFGKNVTIEEPRLWAAYPVDREVLSHVA